MLDLQELLQPYSGQRLADLAKKAGVSLSSASQLKKGRSVQFDIAVKVFKQLGVEPPCEIDEVNAYMRKLWDGSKYKNRLRVCEQLGVAYTTFDRWVYLQTVKPTYVNFLLFCKYVSDDKRIHRYTFGGF